MNVLLFDPYTAYVEKSEVDQAEQMDKLEIVVVPVDLWDAWAFDGGLHCCTTYVFREVYAKTIFQTRLNRLNPI